MPKWSAWTVLNWTSSDGVFSLKDIGVKLDSLYALWFRRTPTRIHAIFPSVEGRDSGFDSLRGFYLESSGPIVLMRRRKTGEAQTQDFPKVFFWDFAHVVGKPNCSVGLYEAANLRPGEWLKAEEVNFKHHTKLQFAKTWEDSEGRTKSFGKFPEKFTSSQVEGSN